MTLPQWRNGVGLTALVLISLSWLWYVFALADTRLRTSIGAIFIGVTGVVLVFTVLATAFATAWNEIPRLHAVAACVLMGLGYHFFGYAHGALKVSHWPNWLKWVVVVPHAVAGFVMTLLWWPKSDRDWGRFAYMAVYLFVFYLIFVREL